MLMGRLGFDLSWESTNQAVILNKVKLQNIPVGIIHQNLIETFNNYVGYIICW